MFSAENKRPRIELEEKREETDNPSKYVKTAENTSERVHTTPSKSSEKENSSSKVNDSPSICFVPNGGGKLLKYDVEKTEGQQPTFVDETGGLNKPKNQTEDSHKVQCKFFPKCL